MIGNHGHVLTSTDGETWTKVPGIDPNADLHSVVFGNGMFVASGANNTMIRFTL
jgi:hypothetical protein